MKIAIIGPQGYPVPAVKGGAIETLIDVIIKENENKESLKIDVYTIYDKQAIEASKNYKKTKFIYLCKNKKLIKIRNKFISLFRRIFKKNFAHTYAQEICKGIRHNDYDRVVVEGDSSLIEPISKVIDKEKIYLHIHHNPLKTNQPQFKKEVLLCNKIITVSRFISKALDECMEDKQVESVVLKNCTKVESFNKDIYIDERKELRNRFNIKDNEITIMFTGRTIWQKGIKELLLAFKQVSNRYNNVKLLIVGNSGFGNEVKTKFDRELKDIAEGIKDKVIFTGFIHNSKMPQIHAMADIAVIPSIYDDPAPLVVMECMASGLAVITTDSGGIPEYVGENNCISIIRDKNIIINLEKALEKLIVDESYRKTLGKNAHNYAQQFNENNFYNDFIEIIS